MDIQTIVCTCSDDFDWMMECDKRSIITSFINLNLLIGVFFIICPTFFRLTSHGIKCMVLIEVVLEILLLIGSVSLD